MVAMLIGAYVFVSLKTSMTGFYKSFNFEYRSNRIRRMCLIQLASAEDKAKTSQHRSKEVQIVYRLFLVNWYLLHVTSDSKKNWDNPQ